MDEIDVQADRRDLGAEDDLQRMIDHDEQHELEDLKVKILFSIQGLGGVQNIRQQDRVFEAYIKGVHCEEAVKDLVKFIRQDAPINPKSKLILAEYNIIETDLLQLLILQVEDKKLSFWLVALLALMTARPSDDLLPSEKEKLTESLQNYKQSFVRHECFQILIVHIADYYKTPEQNRLRPHMQMMEFIIVLLRNLAQIPNSEKFPDLHHHFLAAFVKQDLFNPLLYIVQTDRTPLMEKIDIPLLEIFYHTFTCLQPALLYSKDKFAQNSNHFITSRAFLKSVPVRHSKFMPMFKVTSESGVKKVVHTLEVVSEQPHKNQRKPPVRKTDYKKVVPLSLQSFPQNFMQMKFQSGNKLVTIYQVVLQLSREFLQVEFQQLVKLVFDNIFRQSSKVTETNVIQYLLLCSWALQVVRAKYHKERASATSEVDRCRVEFSLSWVVQIMQTAHFQLFYKLLLREATRQKKKLFRINMYHAGLTVFNSYLDVIMDISNSLSPSDRKNANILMANMFRHDISRILRSGFLQINHEGILALLIKVTHKFFKLLSVYSEGKVLTIQTTKLLKRKKNRSDDNQENQLLDLSDDEQDNEHKDNRRQIDDQRFQQRKYNQKTEFSIICEYKVIDKYILFLKNQRFLYNEQDLNQAIFYYIAQIKKLLAGQWLFFQAEAICTFQKILACADWTRNNKEKAKLIQGICLSFIRLLRKNPLALVESLFHFNSVSHKDQIINNYSQDYEEASEQVENMFTDQ